MRTLGYRYQRTLARPAGVSGVGYLTGVNVGVRFLPAPADSGVVFCRVDLPHRPTIPARVEQVTGTDRRTTLGRPPAHVSLVEHALAALAGLRIDNCCVEVNAGELPGLDGSAKGFTQALLAAGLCLQPARKPLCTVERSVLVRHNGATVALHPADGSELRISYHLDYGPRSPLDRQRHTHLATPECFINELAGCRTFLLKHEAVALRRRGLGLHTQTRDLLVFGPRGPIDNRLRFANEPARHKILDILGDLSLFNQDLRGHIVAYRSGHQLNVALVHALGLHTQGAWRLAG